MNVFLMQLPGILTVLFLRRNLIFQILNFDSELILDTLLILHANLIL